MRIHTRLPARDGHPWRPSGDAHDGADTGGSRAALSLGLRAVLALAVLWPASVEANDYYTELAGSSYATMTTVVVAPTNASTPSTVLLISRTTGVSWAGVNVQFYLDDVLIGTVATDGASQARLYFSTAGLSPGAHTIRAEYPETQRTFTELFATQIIYNSNGTIRRIDRYFYRWTDTAGGSSGTTSFTSSAAPPLFDALTNQVAVEGADVTFAVSGATEPLAFQWLFNGTNIAAGTNATLLLVNVTTNQTGTYFVVGTRAGGLETGSDASLVVGVPPGIAGQPQSQTVPAGNSVTFGVAATGTPPLSYQWWFKGDPLLGATGTNLLLSNLTIDDAGTYSVVVSNAYGTARSDAALLSVSPPVVDPTFRPDAEGAYASVSSLGVQADGKLLVGGFFSTLGGQPISMLGRLNESGTPDIGFQSQSGWNSGVLSLAVQTDGRILVGGGFTTVGVNRDHIARLNANGTVDPGFNPGTSGSVWAVALQPDGKILVGGYFTNLAGQPRRRIGRLNTDGSLDAGFNPGVEGDYFPGVFALAGQPDGKILVGGDFTIIGGVPRTNLARLNPDGTVDIGFAARASARVQTVVLQSDGRILVAGNFTDLAGQPRSRIGRLNADGSLDSSFNPEVAGFASSYVNSMTVQSDGKIILGGVFGTLGGQSRRYIGRLNPEGTLDAEFNPGASFTVRALAIQSDGKILVGGEFDALGGQSRSRIGRLNNTAPATQSLSYENSAITWLRGGGSPEVWRTTFEHAPDGTAWTPLGAGTRIPGGWLLTGVTLPTNGVIRARGFVTGGLYNASSWFVETTLALGEPGGVAPFIISQPESQVVEVGATVVFNVTAGGSPAPFFQWRQDEVDVVGATNATYTISSIQTNHAGTYSVRVTNPHGTAISSNAVLTVLPRSTVLTADESFDYAEGVELPGLDGGSGWAAAWDPNGSPAGGALVVPGSLGYTDAQGNTLVTSGHSGYFAGALDGPTTQPTRYLGALRNAGTTWISFLGVRQGPPTNTLPDNPYPRAANLAFFNDTSERLAIGNITGAPTNAWSILPANTANQLRQSAAPLSQVSLVVVRIDHLGDIAVPDNVHLFINPTLGVEPQVASADAQVLGYADYSFNRIRPFAGGEMTDRPHAEFCLDEIRIGESYLAVTPFVPGAASKEIVVRGTLLTDERFRLLIGHTDGTLPADLSRVVVQWRTTLPTGSDTLWQSVTGGLQVVEGFAVFEDAVVSGQATRFFRVLLRPATLPSRR